MKRERVTAKLIIAPNPILTQVCEPVVDGEDVSGVIADMKAVLADSPSGVGLAAPQAGYPIRVILISPNGFPKVMINPAYQSFNGKKQMGEEGCLSYPGIIKRIDRYTNIDVSYLDDKGHYQCDTFKDWHARIIQHEIDHLNGKCKVGE
jgi:peptide deformylase